MNAAMYTPDQITDVGQFALILKCVQPDKQAIAAAVAEAFINGMITKERLEQAQAERESA